MFLLLVLIFQQLNITRITKFSSTSVCMYKYIYMHIYTHTHMHTHTHTHTYIYIYNVYNLWFLECCWQLFFPHCVVVVVFQWLSCVLLFVTPWTAALQASLSFTISWHLLKLMRIQSVMPSNNLILCNTRLLLPSIFPSIRIFSKEPVFHIKGPKYLSFNFSISPSNEYSGLISFCID